MYDYASGTRCKPWDNRELDILDGLKCISFFMTSVSITAYMLLYTNIIDLLEVQSIVMSTQSWISSVAFATGIAFESFFLISSFLGFYKCF